MALFRPFSPFLPPFPQFFRNLSDTPIGQGVGKKGEKGRKRAIFGYLLANGSHLGVERIVPGEEMRHCAVQHRQMCGQARTIPDCPSGTLPELDKRAKVCGCIEWEGCQPPRWGIDMLAVWALERLMHKVVVVSSRLWLSRVARR
jgi:hypothetical protein